MKSKIEYPLCPKQMSIKCARVPFDTGKKPIRERMYAIIGERQNDKVPCGTYAMIARYVTRSKIPYLILLDLDNVYIVNTKNGIVDDYANFISRN